MAIKTQFSIKDLENLSGVKAHTIRIWEKRYDLFTPERSETNIRKYNLEGLKKLLNVTQLYNQGHKISKIASLSDTDINKLSKETNTSSLDTYLINNFKTAMFSFDGALFEKTYAEMEQQYGFKQAFVEVLSPLMMDLGNLWVMGTIDPIHERYISELVRKKTIIEIEKSLKSFDKKSDKVIALFLPHDEIHELGLLYAQYLLIDTGFQTLYLGSSIPLDDLTHVTKNHQDIAFMTYLTTQPASVNQYLKDFNVKVCSQKEHTLWCLGSKANEINKDVMGVNISAITEIQDFNDQLNQLIDA